MPARKKTSRSSSTRKKSVSKKSSTPSTGVDKMSLKEARNFLEASYSLHLILLLVMTVLAALLLWVVVHQQYKIDSLDFQLRFMRERYNVTKTWNGELLEEYKQDESETLNFGTEEESVEDSMTESE